MRAQQRRIVRRPLHPPTQALLDEVGSTLLARLLASRDLSDPVAAQCRLEHLPDYRLLSGMDAATQLLIKARQAQWSIIVVGDFDADGATSTTLAVRALRMLGFARVDFLVPNRFTFGYGLTPAIVELAAERRPDLLITVDNGISSLRGVARAHELGMRVLITDHHLPGSELPSADAIVNPNQPGDRFPSKSLAGVGVIFYLMIALRARLREEALFGTEQPPNLGQLLDLVALGTIADVVPLDHLNRILVQQGLARIRQGEGCPGIKALCEIARRDPAYLASGDLGFAIGPRLNAAGRLDDMGLGIRCLLSDDMDEARQIAGQLDQLNQRRRQIEQEMQGEALVALESLKRHLSGDLPTGLVLLDPSWHVGVIGILASRIKERLYRPVIIFTEDESGALRGSCRSIPGFHMRDALERIEAQTPGLISRFGGHAMAAGLTLPAGAYKVFALAFEELAVAWLSKEQLDAVLVSDGSLEAEEFSVQSAEALQLAFPWGQAFPEPLFDDWLAIQERKSVGDKHLKLKLRHHCGRVLEAMVFNAEGAICDPLYKGGRFAYRINVNRYWQEPRLQLLVEEFWPEAKPQLIGEEG